MRVRERKWPKSGKRREREKARSFHGKLSQQKRGEKKTEQITFNLAKLPNCEDTTQTVSLSSLPNERRKKEIGEPKDKDRQLRTAAAAESEEKE